MMIALSAQDRMSSLTSEAWATLLAAFIGAFAALIVVIVQRALELRDRKKERRRKRRSVAKALLFEIDGFHGYYLKDLDRWLSEFAMRRHELPPTAIRSTSFNPFPVYDSNAGFLGEFSDEVVPPVVRFYAEALSYASLLREYRTVMNEKYVAQSQVQVVALGDKLYGELVDRLPNVITLARDACTALHREVTVAMKGGEIGLLDNQT